MKIRVEGLTETPLELSAKEPVSDYPALSELQDSGECDFLAPLELRIGARKEFDHVRVHGHVETRVMLSCSRCLIRYESALVSDFTIFYSKSSEFPVEEEVALTEEDLVSASYEGECIDLSSEIEEQVLLEIPFKPLCSDECKGICPECGADLNSEECGCTPSATGFKFSSLKDFKVKR
jgi:uncharacterized protein